MADLATVGQLLQERGLLAFEVLSISRKPASNAELRAKKEKQLEELDRRIDKLELLPPSCHRSRAKPTGAKGEELDSQN